MHVFIDESGDVGTNLERAGTSAHFTVAAVIVSSDVEVDRCREGLLAFKAKKRLKRAEFKFNQCDRLLRKEYLSAAVSLPWRFIPLTVDKVQLLKTGPCPDLYLHAVSNWFVLAQPVLDLATIVFDSCGGTEFRRAVARCCRVPARSNEPARVRRVLAQSSHSEPLLQLADMVVGSVARALRTDLPDSRTYLEIIQRRAHPITQSQK